MLCLDLKNKLLINNMKNNYLTAFNNLVIKFNNDLITTFPEEKEFEVYKRSIEWLRESNAKKLCNLFKVYTLDYRNKMLEKNESFFLESNYSDVINKNDEGIVLIINKLKKHWSSLSENNKDVIWEYMCSLIKLSDLVV